jgi:hypothetical protein
VTSWRFWRSTLGRRARANVVFHVLGPGPGTGLYGPSGPGHQLVVGLVGGAVGLLHQVGPGVVAGHEAHAVFVPAVELGRQGGTGVAAQQYVGKAAFPAERYGPVVEPDDALVGGAVGAVLGEVQGLFGVGEVHHEAGVAPFAVVGDVHTLFGLPVGRHDRGVGTDLGRLAKSLAAGPPTP